MCIEVAKFIQYIELFIYQPLFLGCLILEQWQFDGNCDGLVTYYGCMAQI